MPLLEAHHDASFSELLLLASLFALAIGPLLHRASARAPAALAILDGFIFVSITAMVLGHVMPGAWDRSGLVGVAAAVLGFGGPLLIERWLHQAARTAHTVALMLAIIGLLVHGMVDGAALLADDDALPFAVILHRLPVGLTLWLLLRKPYGIGIAAGVLAVVGAATAVGFLVGPRLLAMLPAAGYGAFEGLVAGSLLHVVVHRSRASNWTFRGWRVGGGLGALLGLGAALAVEHTAHEHGAGGAAESTFLNLALESAPALVLAYLFAGVIHAWMPHSGVAWLRGRSRLGQAARGVAFGLPLPMCSCGVVPVYRSLVLRGAPPAAAMSFFVATPELGADAIFLSFPLLGPEITLARVLAAVIAALLVGLVVSAVAERRPVAEPEPAEPGRSHRERLREAVRIGLGELVDATMPWILLGLGVAALLDPWLAGPDSWLGDVPFAIQIPLFALIGLPAYVCASGATPLVAVIVAHGVSPGAAIAFLLTGPATNVTTFGVLADLHGRRVAALFAGAMAAVAIGLGYLVDLVLPSAITVPEPHPHGEEAGWWQWASLVALGLLVLASLMRQGPRGMAGQIAASAGHDHHHEHEQDEHHPHAHAHGHAH